MFLSIKDVGFFSLLWNCKFFAKLLTMLIWCFRLLRSCFLFKAPL